MAPVVMSLATTRHPEGIIHSAFPTHMCSCSVHSTTQYQDADQVYQPTPQVSSTGMLLLSWK